VTFLRDNLVFGTMVGVSPRKGCDVSRAQSSGAPQRLQALIDNPRADVLIIGAGINGIATFRDLAHQGVSVLLVDAKDFSSGASAASSHMVHGGIRYLENGEFRLVKESLQERNRLLVNAPHLVSPLHTVIPIFSTFSGMLSAPLRVFTHKSGPPKERGALLIKLGLMMYDTFGLAKGTLGRHRFLGRKKSLTEVPGLNPTVKYTAHYFDAAMAKPERLALDVLLDGLAEGDHARAYNYLAATGMTGDSIHLTDHLTGTTVDVTASVVINATGPWTDITNKTLGVDTHFMGGTKGSHIVVDHPDLFQSCKGREIFFENSDGRIVLIYPVQGRVLIGTTDLPIDNPDDAVCTEEEVDYFIDLVGHVFPDYPIDRSHIVHRLSGVRPLPAAGDLTPGMISRDYRVVPGTFANNTPLISLVGGKWTTFRALGEHLAKEALGILGVEHTRTTADLPIGGGRGYPTTEAARKKWIEENKGDHDEARVDTLLNRYGTRATQFLRAEQPGEAPLACLPTYTRSEIVTIITAEHVMRLDDLIFRRTGLGFTGSVTPEVSHELAAILADVRHDGDQTLRNSETRTL
jgi:glycerol-3-phosphate dehydrogenase